MRAIACAIAIFLLTLNGSTMAESPKDEAYDRDVRPFLKQHCYQCHDARKSQAGFRIDELGTDFLSGMNAEQWREVIDQINIGQMPPKDEPRPDPKAAYAVVEWVGHQLKAAEREARMAGGRILMRRLNREEYANTAGDLFGLDPNFVKKLKLELPADGKAEGFDRIGAALFVDRTQMMKYLEIADLIAREAIQSEPPPVGNYVWKPDRRPEPSLVSVQAGGLAGKNMIPLGVTYFELRGTGFETWCGNGSNDKGEKYGAKIPPGPMPSLDKVVTQDGYYRVRVRGGAFAGERNEPISIQLKYGLGTPIESDFTIAINGTLDHPGVTETTVFLRAGTPEQKKGFQIRWNGLTDVRLKNPDLAPLLLKRLQLTGKKQKAIAARDDAEANSLGRELDAVLVQLEAFDGPEWIANKKYDLMKIPRLLLQTIEVEGPILREWPPTSHQRLGIADRFPESESDVRAVFTRILPRAYRRPVEAMEVDQIVQVARQAMKEHGHSMIDGVRMSLQTMLCSPGFVYIQEPQDGASDQSRPLNDFELASRLSYFLWSSQPDEELLQVAARGKLKDAAELKGQVNRMLANEKSQRLVTGFAGQWLSVDQFGSVMPAKEYRDFDKELEKASREEPLAFFDHLLRNNLSILNLINSDFVVINERLARHYGIEWIDGGNRNDGFQVVAIRPEHHRGGVLGMAGLLTLLADGTRTLPVRRAAWVLENLLNDPPAPPPPNAGEIQPNTQGKNLTVRERLALHRSEATCASCHAKLDGYGLALENYDAIGAWRTKANGEGFRESKAPPIDASGMLKSGQVFQDIEGFKAAMLEEKDKFTRAFSEKMLTYAIGRPIGYVDRKSVDVLCQSLADDGYRIHSLIHAITASELFQTK